MKIFWSIIISIVLTLSLYSRSFSQAEDQSFNFDKAYKDYEYSYGIYLKANSDYEFARNQYLTFKTLQSKDQAVQTTFKMLQSRDEATKTYLTALKLKLSETTGVTDLEKESLFSRIDEDVKWYLEHKENLSSSATLEDLTEDSEEAKGHYQITEILIYQTLITVFSGKENTLRTKTENIISDLKNKISEINANQDKNTQIVERWVLEAENRLVRSKGKVADANSELTRLKIGDSGKISYYNDAQFRIVEAHQYLKEAVSYLGEILKEIKKAD